MPVYNFDIEHATTYGVNEAIFISNLTHWLRKNRGNEKHHHDGHWWTYNSKEAFKELFPFWTYAQIRGIIDRLIKAEVILIGNYNVNKFDRKGWYAFKDEDVFLGTPTTSQKHDVDLLKNADETCENSQMNIDTNNKPNKNHKNITKKESLKITLPAWEEVNGRLDHSKIRNWCFEQKLDFGRVSAEIEDFRARVTARGNLYVNFVSAFQVWLRAGYFKPFVHYQTDLTRPAVAAPPIARSREMNATDL